MSGAGTFLAAASFAISLVSLAYVAGRENQPESLKFAPATMAYSTAWGDSEPWFTFRRGPDEFKCKTLRASGAGRFAIRNLRGGDEYQLATRVRYPTVPDVVDCWVRERP